MKRSRLAFAIVASLWATTCNLIWKADEYTFGEVACTAATDCPGSDGPCQSRACLDGRCTLSIVPPDVPLDSQTAGDCAVLSCDGLGAATSLPDDEDLPDDGLECTEDICLDGMADNPPLPSGTPCNGASGDFCDGRGMCLAATCGNGVVDGDESDLDCGGSCMPCHGGMACNGPTDCDSGVCTDMLCKYPNCIDGVHNGDETDLDCGGPCPACPDGNGCNLPTDCESGICEIDQCVAATCSDGLQNGSETDVDCGGVACTDCSDGLACLVAGDCASGHCDLEKCVPASCADNALGAGETDVDCGGPACAACADGLGCQMGSDCINGTCQGMMCQSGNCNDGIDNGMETDVDCGGPTCPACPVGDGCAVDGDCTTTVCLTGTCALLNGCNPATAADHTASSSVSISFQGTGNLYVPPCIRVAAGASVVFNGNFSAHPLEGGKVIVGVSQYDPTSPFSPATMGGSSKSFTMSSPGMFPYYCIPHAGGGMYGAVFVE